MVSRQENWLIVFVKAPTPGRVKTRLVPFLSPTDAAALYRCLVQDTLDVAKRVQGVNLAVAYAANQKRGTVLEKKGDGSLFSQVGKQKNRPHFRTVPHFFQHGQTLGERLEHACRWVFEQGGSRVVIIGSDAPDLTTAWLRRAFRLLDDADVVLGPTTDGGYHLIGLTRPHPELFTEMPWSTPQLFGRTLQRIGDLGLSVRCLEPITDLDTPEDVQRYLEAAAGSRRRTRRFLERLLVVKR